MGERAERNYGRLSAIERKVDALAATVERGFAAVDIAVDRRTLARLSGCDVTAHGVSDACKRGVEHERQPSVPVQTKRREGPALRRLRPREDQKMSNSSSVGVVSSGP